MRASAINGHVCSPPNDQMSGTRISRSSMHATAKIGQMTYLNVGVATATVAVPPITVAPRPGGFFPNRLRP
jgi:hypothetical protein